MAQARAATRAVDNGGESGNVIHPPNQTLGSVSSWMGGGGWAPSMAHNGAHSQLSIMGLSGGSQF